MIYGLILSPYEKDRIIPHSFGLTEMGRDLLAEDYMLKQITASLIYPEDEVGKKFWKRIYEEAQKRYGTTNVPVNTFNKVWIVPEKAVVFENAKAGTAYVVESKLKVMLEQDYLSFENHEGIQSVQSQAKDTNQLGSQIVREIVIPELTKEVNENKNFSHLRQVYNSLILATWYKKKIKDSILEQVYADKNKVAGVNINDPQEKEKIYQRYLRAFKKGVYNYIKEDVDPVTQETIPRKYFSGGVLFDLTGQDKTSLAMTAFKVTSNQAMVNSATEEERPLVVVEEKMSAVEPEEMAMPEQAPDKGMLIKKLKETAISILWAHPSYKLNNMVTKKGDTPRIFIARFLRKYPPIIDLNSMSEKNQLEVFNKLKEENPRLSFPETLDGEFEPGINVVTDKLFENAARLYSLEKMNALGAEYISLGKVEKMVIVTNTGGPYSGTSANKGGILINLKGIIYDVEELSKIIKKRRPGEDALYDAYHKYGIVGMIRESLRGTIIHELTHQLVKELLSQKEFQIKFLRFLRNKGITLYRAGPTADELAAFLSELTYSNIPRRTLSENSAFAIMPVGEHGRATRALLRELLPRIGYKSSKMNFRKREKYIDSLGVESDELIRQEARKILVEVFGSVPIEDKYIPNIDAFVEKVMEAAKKSGGINQAMLTEKMGAVPSNFRALARAHGQFYNQVIDVYLEAGGTLQDKEAKIERLIDNLPGVVNTSFRAGYRKALVGLNQSLQKNHDLLEDFRRGGVDALMTQIVRVSEDNDHPADKLIEGFRPIKEFLYERFSQLDRKDRDAIYFLSNTILRFHSGTFEEKKVLLEGVIKFYLSHKSDEVKPAELVESTQGVFVMELEEDFYDFLVAQGIIFPSTAIALLGQSEKGVSFMYTQKAYVQGSTLEKMAKRHEFHHLLWNFLGHNDFLRKNNIVDKEVGHAFERYRDEISAYLLDGANFRGGGHGMTYSDNPRIIEMAGNVGDYLDLMVRAGGIVGISRFDFIYSVMTSRNFDELKQKIADVFDVNAISHEILVVLLMSQNGNPYKILPEFLQSHGVILSNSDLEEGVLKYVNSQKIGSLSRLDNLLERADQLSRSLGLRSPSAFIRTKVLSSQWNQLPRASVEQILTLPTIMYSSLPFNADSQEVEKHLLKWYTADDKLQFEGMRRVFLSSPEFIQVFLQSVDYEIKMGEEGYRKEVGRHKPEVEVERNISARSGNLRKLESEARLLEAVEAGVGGQLGVGRDEAMIGVLPEGHPLPIKSLENVAYPKDIPGFVNELLPIFQNKSAHPRSQNLTLNPYSIGNSLAAYEPYKEQLRRFKQSASTIRGLSKISDDGYSFYDDVYRENNPMQVKSNFKFYNKAGTRELDIGWKLHLNVTPENLQKVADYLITNGYLHKCFAGGDLEDGKVFTIYIGSLKLTQKLAKKISDDIGPYLSRPVDPGEIEFAPGVIGRFSVTGRDFVKYGYWGIAVLEKWMYHSPHEIQPIGKRTQKDRERIWIESAKELVRRYGSYFAPVMPIGFKGFIDNAMQGKEKTFSNTGGIDLTPANMNLQTQNAGDGIKFHLNPAMLAQLLKAPGFVPVIINIQPLKDLKTFLEI